MRLPALVALPVLALATLAAAPAGHDRGPGVAGQRQGDAMVYRLGGFDRVSIGTAGTADVRVGPDYSVQVSGPAEALANLRVIRTDRGLEIGRRWDDRNWTDADRRLRIAVTLPRLTAFAFGGSGSARIDRIAAPAFEAAVGGSGAVTFADLAVGKAEFALGGSGSIAAAGRADTLDISLGGSGQFRGAQLQARTASVSAGGSGRVTAAVDGPAHVSAVGSASIDLGPRARCDVTKTGSARIRCGG